MRSCACRSQCTMSLCRFIHIFSLTIRPHLQVLDLRRRILSELRTSRWIDPLPQAPECCSCTQHDEAEPDLCARATTPPAMTGAGGLDPHDWPIFDAVNLAHRAVRACRGTPVSIFGAVFGVCPARHTLPGAALSPFYNRQKSSTPLRSLHSHLLNPTPQTLPRWLPAPLLSMLLA